MPRPYALPLLLFLCACPESEPVDTTTRDGGPNVTTDAGTRDGGDLTNETPGDRIARLVCEREVECCPGNSSNCDILGSVLDARFTGPGIELDPTGYDACVAKIQNATCDEVVDFGGRLPFARFCDADATTRPTLDNGAACGGLFADLACRSGRCGPDDTCIDLAGDGEDCGPGECAAGLKCSLGTCRIPTAADEVCEQNSVCVDGYECFRMNPNEDARCHAITTIAVGETCGRGLECTLGPDECRCPRGQTGCGRGVCGSRSYCLP
ncbi:MAG: hypothetical protein RMA76_37635 [Deltaproteobacteria bacterium]|jgi:hypothetical protein